MLGTASDPFGAISPESGNDARKHARHNEIGPFQGIARGQATDMSTRYTYRGPATAAGIVSAVGGIFALVEAVYILMLLLHANQGNGFFRFIKSLAEPLALFFPGLFTLDNADLNIILNYGLAAIFWLVVTGIIARLVARI